MAKKNPALIGSPDAPENKLLKSIHEFGATRGTSRVFSELLEMVAISLNAQADAARTEMQNKRYKEMEKSMTPKELSRYTQLTAQLMSCFLEYAHDPKDVLGYVFEHLGFGSARSGQFFTPDDIAFLMSNILNAAAEADNFSGYTSENNLPECGYYTLCDPTCGSGVMAVQYVKDCQDSGFDYQHKALFTLIDIDIRCVWMAYIQAYLYGLPARVVHGDSFTEKYWSFWYTSACANIPGLGQPVGEVGGMLTWMYCRALAEVLMDESMPSKLREQKFATLNKVFGRITAYENEHFDNSLLEKIFEKKIAQIKAAATLKDLEIIGKICEVRYQGDGSLVPRHPAFHIVEEELIQWSMASLKAPPGREAVKRMEQIFPLVYPNHKNPFEGL